MGGKPKRKPSEPAKTIVLTRAQCAAIRRAVKAMIPAMRYVEVGFRVDLDKPDQPETLNCLAVGANSDLNNIIPLHDVARETIATVGGRAVIDLYVYSWLEGPRRDDNSELDTNLDCALEADGSFEVYDPFARNRPCSGCGEFLRAYPRIGGGQVCRTPGCPSRGLQQLPIGRKA